MKIVDDKVEGCAFDPSPNTGPGITPRVIVMHYTATPDAASAIRTLKRAGSQVSAHLVIDLDGTVTQLVPFRTKAWHAGVSHLDLPTGRLTSLNWHSIGIEIVNMGWLRRSEEGCYIRDGRDVTAAVSGVQMLQVPWDRVGSGAVYWPAYPEAQLDAVEEVTRALLEAYPSIEAIVGHSDITHRKQDPGPAFPIQRYQRLISDRHRDGDDEVVVPPSTPPPVIVTPAPEPSPAPAPSTPQSPRPAPPSPDATSRPPNRPLAQSRTIWGALVAGVMGVVAFIRDLFADPAAWWARAKASFIEAYGFNPAWLLLAVFLFAIALVIYARIDDRQRRGR